MMFLLMVLDGNISISPISIAALATYKYITTIENTVYDRFPKDRIEINNLMKDRQLWCIAVFFRNEGLGARKVAS